VSPISDPQPILAPSAGRPRRPAKARRNSAGDDAFDTLLGKRRLYGALAELARSHYGLDEPTSDLDHLVLLLTDELETRFPKRWAAVEDRVLAQDSFYLHLPYDPTDTDPPPLLTTCRLCRERAGVDAPPTPGSGDRTAAPREACSPPAAAAEPASRMRAVREAS
jgi:hypothetical protein